MFSQTFVCVKTPDNPARNVFPNFCVRQHTRHLARIVIQTFVHVNTPDSPARNVIQTCVRVNTPDSPARNVFPNFCVH